MASSFTFKRGDTVPNLEATLSDQAGPIDLTSATQVKLIMKNGLSTVTGICDIVDALTGQVMYTWQPANTTTVGDYEAEFEITWGPNLIETVPNDGTITISIVQDLG